MSRLSAASRDKVPQDQVGHFDEIVKQYGDSASHGPPSLLLHAPITWRLERDLRDYLRFESSLSGDIVELVVLVSARELDCQYVWNAHVVPARKAGIADDLIDALRDRKELPALSDKYLAAINFGREFFRTNFVSSGTFSLTKEQFGERGVVELGLLFGNYYMLAALLNSTDAPLRPNLTEPVLPICRPDEMNGERR